MSRRFLTCVVLAAIAVRGSTLRSQERTPDLHGFLSSSIGLGAAELRALADGQPVTKLLPSREGRDIVIFGIVAVNEPVHAVGAAIADHARILAAPGRSLVLLPDSVEARELTGITMTDDDVRSLRACHTGSCHFKLSAEEMSKAALEVEHSPDAKAAVLFEQEHFAEIANAYRHAGTAALPYYSDYGKRTIAAADAFNAIVDNNPLLPLAPGLKSYLTEYPRAELPGAHALLFLSVDEAQGIKKTASLSQRVVYAPAGDPEHSTVAAVKQLAADHYLEAALDITIAVESGGQSYLMFARQYRFDQMPKVFFVSLRGRVSSKLIERASADLARYRSDVMK